MITDLIVETKTAVDRFPDVDWKATCHLDVAIQRQARAWDIEPHHVNLCFHSEIAPKLLPQGRGTPSHVLRSLHLTAEEDVVNRHPPRACDDPGRAHAAAEELARLVGPLDEDGSAGDDAADRCAEPLGQVHLDPIEALAYFTQCAGAGGGADVFQRHYGASQGII